MYERCVRSRMDFRSTQWLNLRFEPSFHRKFCKYMWATQGLHPFSDFKNNTALVNAFDWEPFLLPHYHVVSTLYALLAVQRQMLAFACFTRTDSFSPGDGKCKTHQNAKLKVYICLRYICYTCFPHLTHLTLLNSTLVHVALSTSEELHFVLLQFLPSHCHASWFNA